MVTRKARPGAGRPDSVKNWRRDARGKPLALPAILACARSRRCDLPRSGEKSLRRYELVTSPSGRTTWTLMGSGAPGPRKPFTFYRFNNVLRSISAGLTASPRSPHHPVEPWRPPVYCVLTRRQGTNWFSPTKPSYICVVRSRSWTVSMLQF